MLIKMVSDGETITGIEIDGISVGSRLCGVKYTHFSAVLRKLLKKGKIVGKLPRLRLYDIDGHVWDSRKDSFDTLKARIDPNQMTFREICDRCERKEQAAWNLGLNGGDKHGL